MKKYDGIIPYEEVYNEVEKYSWLKTRDEFLDNVLAPLGIIYDTVSLASNLEYFKAYCRKNNYKATVDYNGGLLLFEVSSGIVNYDGLFRAIQQSVLFDIYASYVREYKTDGFEYEKTYNRYVGLTHEKIRDIALKRAIEVFNRLFM